MTRSNLPDTHRQVSAFLARLEQVPAPVPSQGGRRGRLIFALDATASRQPTWDRACRIQADMFDETAALGGLEVQLAWYRGLGEFQAGAWVARPSALRDAMADVTCASGKTQIGEVLAHAEREAARGRVQALVFVGDCLEEPADTLLALAGRLALRNVPVFLFHDGDDPTARQVFEQIARLTRGACCRFDANSAQALRDLLAGVAVFASGGRTALKALAEKRGGAVQALLSRLGG